MPPKMVAPIFHMGLYRIRSGNQARAAGARRDLSAKPDSQNPKRQQNREGGLPQGSPRPGGLSRQPAPRRPRYSEAPPSCGNHNGLLGQLRGWWRAESPPIAQACVMQRPNFRPRGFDSRQIHFLSSSKPPNRTWLRLWYKSLVIRLLSLLSQIDRSTTGDGQVRLLRHEGVVVSSGRSVGNIF